jgi:hypothetical protein
MSLLILNAHDGSSWYPQGQERLKKSLDSIGGFDYQLNCFHRTGYMCKAIALDSVSNNYLPARQILWVDSSVWAIRPADDLYVFIKNNGYFIQPSGYSVGETCNDETLDHFGVSREHAYDIPDCWTIGFGFDLTLPAMRKIVSHFIDLRGFFPGSREQISTKRRTRMFNHRNDQSVMSLLLWQNGYKPNGDNGFFAYPGQEAENTIFLMKGM